MSVFLVTLLVFAGAADAFLMACLVAVLALLVRSRLIPVLLALIRGLLEVVGLSVGLAANSVTVLSSEAACGWVGAFCDVRLLALVSASTSSARNSIASLSSTALIN